jgi:hypothetical protein
MTLDDQLLKKAHRQGELLVEAERHAQLARADYHTAVRRLHLAGGSLREVAHALGLSHQRVQQIINGAGGTWWQRVWRSRTVRVDAVCTFCGRPPGEVAKLIAGPNVYICDACVAGAEAVLEPGATTATRGGTPLAAAQSLTARCSFCGKRRAGNRSIVGEPAARICGECLRLCRQILDDRAA